MKVVAVNGSPRPEGNTSIAIKTFLDELEKEGIQTGLLNVGGANTAGCKCCGGCRKSGRCQIPDEVFSAWSEDLFSADGLFLAAPSYFGSIPGPMKSFLDRFFYQCLKAGTMYQKAGASIAVLRRIGGFTTLDDLNRYFFSSGMIIVSATGASLIHGSVPGEVLQDAEGIDGILKLARNMAWVLKMMEATKDRILPPAFTKKPMTNFIR